MKDWRQEKMKDYNKILKSDEKANAYKLCRSNGSVHKQILDNYDFIEMSKLFEL